MTRSFPERLFVAACVLGLLRSHLLLCARGLKLPRAGDSSNAPLTGPLPTTTRPPYLVLPAFLDSRTPLLDPEHFKPAEGTGEDPLPELMLELLRATRTEPPPTEPPPEVFVRIDCKHNRMFVEVDRSVLGSSDPMTTLRLGTCFPKRATVDYAYFELNLTECGTEQTVTLDLDQVVFNNTLHYEPEESGSLIRRSAPFILPLSCFFNRYQYSYMLAYIPKPIVQNLFKRMRKRERFTLAPKNAQWGSSSDAFTLGEPMFFEAQTEMLSSEQRLYVHSCFATPEPSTASAQRFDVIGNYGCMVESKNGHSAFIPSANNAVRFSVDAFGFSGFNGNMLYMHCAMSVGPYFPTDTAKSCNFHSNISRWVELNGMDSVCSCCETTCDSPTSTETVVSSNAWNIENKRKKSKRKRPKTSKRKSKSRLRALRPMPARPEDPKVIRWAVSEAEPQEVTGSAYVEKVQRPEKETVPAERPEKETAPAKRPEKKTVLAKRPEKGTVLAKRPEKGTVLAKRPEKGTVLAKRPEKGTVLAKRPEKGTVLAKRPEKGTVLAKRPEKGTVLAKRPEKETVPAEGPEKETVPPKELEKETVPPKELPWNEMIPSLKPDKEFFQVRKPEEGRFLIFEEIFGLDKKQQPKD